MHPLRIVQTKDGSNTVLNTELGSTYHSRHGAITESKHVFLDKGLRKQLERQVTDITLLEMGLGTGLNALLTLKEVLQQPVRINYHSLELYPIPESVWSTFKLPNELSDFQTEFEEMHTSDWGMKIQLSDNFEITKHQISLLDFVGDVRFDVVYFDAFEPETQPELWTEEVFSRLFEMMNLEGVLTTYCCKGYVRRNMISAGFVVEKVAGPPGKREMLVAKRTL